jgi:hypothetical protein
MGREMKGKLAYGVGSQFPSHYLGTWCIQHYYRWCAHLGCQQSTELTPPADLNGLVRFVERQNLVSARVPSHFKRSLRNYYELHTYAAVPWRCRHYYPPKKWCLFITLFDRGYKYQCPVGCNAIRLSCINVPRKTADSDINLTWW